MKIIDIDNPDYDISECEIEQRSFDTSTVTLTIIAPDIRTLCPYRYNDIYRVLYKGKVVLEGPCQDPVIDAETSTWTICICDYWDWLDRTPFLGLYPAQIDPTPGRPGTDSSNFILKQIIGAPKQAGAENGVKTTMQDILRAARSVNILPADYDVRITAYEMIPYVTSSATYASVLQSIHDWAPNSVSWFDYSAVTAAMLSGDPARIAATRPKLVIADPASLSVIDIPISQVDVTSLKLKARSDLVPPLVAVIGTDTDSVGCFVTVNSICPRGGNLQQPGNLIIQLDAGSLPATETPTDPDEPEDPENPDKPTGTRKWDNTPTMIIRGADIPTSGDKCREFWARHAQPLSEIPGLVFGAQTITPTPTTGNEGKNYSADATRYELREGLISNKTAGIKWCKVFIKQAIGYPGLAVPKKYEALFPKVRTDGHRWGWHSLELVTTNVRLKQYRIGGRYEESDPPPPEEEEEEEETPPPGEITPQQTARYDLKVASYYNATRIIPYDGTIPLRLTRPDIHVGTRINILGSYPAWENMQTIVQTIQTDGSSDAMILTVGPPKHLRPDKAHKNTQLLSDQAAETKEETAPDASGGTTFSWDNQFERKKKAENPGIGPYSKYIPPSDSPPFSGDFAVRAVSGEDGTVGYQVHGGRFYGVATGGFFACGSGWEACGDSEVWANLETDKGGVPQYAHFSSTPGRMRPWFPVWKNDNMNEGIDMGRTEPGYYTYRVASIRNGEITQHIVGPIPVTYYIHTLAF